MDGRAVAIPTRKARALLGYLALREGTQVARTTLTGLLWGDRGEDQARASLRTTLSELRTALAGADALEANKETVAWVPGSAWIDASVLKAAAGSTDQGALEAAAELIGGELMEGLDVDEAGFEHWLAAEREHFRTLAGKALSGLMQSAEDAGRLEDVLDYGARLLAINPLQEHVHRGLMRVFAAQGRQDAALAQYERCRRELADQLGVKPGQETEDLAVQIRKSRRDLPPRPQGAPSPEPAQREQVLPDKPSIAVLPFTNLSADAEQRYLSDGITEDIITELSRYRELFVIARNSSFQYRDMAADMKRIGSELGVAYLVEGSVRKAGDRIRVSAQLVAAATGSQLWAERYDRGLEDIFAVQDEVAQTIAATLVGRVAASGTESARRKPTNLWAAYDCFLQALECNNHYETDRALEFLRRAIEIDSRYAQAYAMLAFVHIHRFFADYRDDSLNTALAHARTALSIDDNDGLSQAIMGLVQGHLLQWDLARMHLEKAVRLNPNSVLCASLFANLLLRVGRAPEALEVLDAALKRDPLQPPWYWEARALALIRERRYAEAIDSLNRKYPHQSWDHATLAIAHALIGQDREAAREAAITVAMQPDFSSAGYAKTAPYQSPADLAEMVQGMRRAGLPD